MFFNTWRRIQNRVQLLKYKYTLNRVNHYRNHGSNWNLKIRVEGRDNSIEIAEGCSLRHLTIVIKGDNHFLKIGKDVNIKSGLIWFEGSRNLIEIGKETTIEEATIAVIEERNQIVIGEDCMLSDKIMIRNGDSHSIIDNTTGKRINPSGNIIIKNKVWIGSNVTILKNVTIDTGAIVGINSLVTRDVSAGNLVAGSPVSVLRENITWDRKLL